MTILRAPSKRFCAVIGERRPNDSSSSARIGNTKLSFVTRGPVMKKEESKEREDTFDVTIWFQCRRPNRWSHSTNIYWKRVEPICYEISTGARGQSVKIWRSSEECCWGYRRKTSSWPKRAMAVSMTKGAFWCGPTLIRRPYAQAHRQECESCRRRLRFGMRGEGSPSIRDLIRRGNRFWSWNII